MKVFNPLFFFILIIILLPKHSDSQWIWQNPLPQGNKLNDVFFIDPESGWAVGDAGTIMKSTDGGQTFILLNFPTHLNFSSVEFFDLNNGIVTGESGIILLSNDGGLNWNRVETGFSANITDMCIINNSIIWLSCDDGTVMKSIDYGESWQIVYNNASFRFNTISFADELHGWAAGANDAHDPGMVTTSDGGISWTSLEPPFLEEIFDICFADSLIGYASFYSNYEHSLAKTTDGGQSWQFLLDDVFYDEFYDIEFIDTEHGWIAGSSATIPSSWGVAYRTSDGGTTWHDCAITGDDKDDAFSAICFINEDKGWMVGSLGSLIYSNDGGIQWTNITTGFGGNCIFEDVFFTDDLNGWAVGAGFYPFKSGILHTSDGGYSWTPQQDLDHMLNSVFFINPTEGWIVGGKSLYQYSTAIYHTTDGGNQWEKQFSENINDGDFSDVFFKDPEHGWAVGAGTNYYPPENISLFYYSEDGGENWTDNSGIIPHALSAICFVDDETGYLSGHKTILKTTDGGENWTEVWTGPHYLKDIFFTDANHGWAVGDSATRYPYRDVIMRTTNGGSTWDEQFPGLSSTEKQLFFTDYTHGWIARDEGDILYTVDGGLTWQHMLINYNWAFGGIFFTDIDDGWVVGGNKTIFHISNGGAVGFPESSVISHQSSVAVYPNPTRGVFNIQFLTHELQSFTIKIYDLQGQEIGVVLDRKMQAGKRTIQWDASNLKAGVYLYQITANGQFSTSGKFIKD